MSMMCVFFGNSNYYNYQILQQLIILIFFSQQFLFLKGREMNKKPHFQSQKYFSNCHSPNKRSLVQTDSKISSHQLSPLKKESVQLFTTIITLRLANTCYQIPTSPQDTVRSLIKKLLELLQPLNPQLVKEIIGFTTITNNFALDYYLTQPALPISIFHNITVQPLFSSPPQSRQVGLKDFVFLYPIGSGGFSVVYLCRKRNSGQFYALKIIDKQLVKDSGKQYLVENEARILKKLHHRFVTKLHYSFENKHFVVFALEFCAGGDLFYHLTKLNKFTEYQAAYYMTELVIGLEYIHSHNIIYRDFKPENILFDLQGHVKIGDFGLGKCSQRSYSFCGSAEYMAPEMLQKTGHGQSLDYYNLGAVLYEMLNGVPPFYSNDQEQMYEDILHKELKFNKGVSPQAQDLIRKLMDRNAKKRLQSGVLEHAFFKGVDVKGVREGKVEAPLKVNPLILNFNLSDCKKADSILKQGVVWHIHCRDKLRGVNEKDEEEDLFGQSFYYEAMSE